jgi:putative tryptophan/tyrosine transport system substrate-binding protein
VAGDRWFVQGGGLMSYGPDPVDVYERAASYTGKLLRGGRPHVISSVTARALGLKISRSLLARADQVIE